MEIRLSQPLALPKKWAHEKMLEKVYILFNYCAIQLDQVFSNKVNANLRGKSLAEEKMECCSDLGLGLWRIKQKTYPIIRSRDIRNFWNRKSTWAPFVFLMRGVDCPAVWSQPRSVLQVSLPLWSHGEIGLSRADACAALAVWRVSSGEKRWGALGKVWAVVVGSSCHGNRGPAGSAARWCGWHDMPMWLAGHILQGLARCPLMFFVMNVLSIPTQQPLQWIYPVPRLRCHCISSKVRDPTPTSFPRRREKPQEEGSYGPDREDDAQAHRRPSAASGPPGASWSACGCSLGVWAGEIKAAGLRAYLPWGSVRTQGSYRHPPEIWLQFLSAGLAQHRENPTGSSCRSTGTFAFPPKDTFSFTWESVQAELWNWDPWGIKLHFPRARSLRDSPIWRHVTPRGSSAGAGDSKYPFNGWKIDR